MIPKGHCDTDPFLSEWLEYSSANGQRVEARDLLMLFLLSTFWNCLTLPYVYLPPENPSFAKRNNELAAPSISLQSLKLM